MNLLTAFSVLYSNGLLREATLGPHEWTLDPDRLPHADISSVTYDSRRIEKGTLLFCKGAFRSSYLETADDRGLLAYVSEKEYTKFTRAVGFIVTDVRKAMALLSAQFYGHPERHLTLIGITGTKGKTTTAYLVHAILAAQTGNRCALLSSESNCVDGKTWKRSQLTTPESADLFRLMRQAVDAGMKDLVMEVSSQAYKINRVWGITFDVGAFLNISPDHISPIEHPTFEDYFYCKRRLIRNSRLVVLNADLGRKTQLLREEALLAHHPAITFSMIGLTGQAGSTSFTDSDSASHADLIGTPVATDENGKRFSHFYLRKTPTVPGTAGKTVDLGVFHLNLEGDFNYDNALAAVAICLTAGVSPNETAALHAMETVTIPGRMQHFTSRDGLEIYVDYAHNYLSLHALLAFAREKYSNAYVTVVTGATGGKAIDRRDGLAKAANELADALVLTTDDPGPEDPAVIAQQMLDDIAQSDRAHSDTALRTHVELDREKAISYAFDLAREQRKADTANTRQTTDKSASSTSSSIRTQVILVAGKGDEAKQIVKGRSVPYASDTTIVANLCQE